ncbi:Mitochondrial inner membrane protease subunit, partial [Lachnellula suecica]
MPLRFKPFSHPLYTTLRPYIRILATTINTILISHIFLKHYYTIQPTWGASMLPTLSAYGDHVLISQHHRRGRDIRVGDVVCFSSVVESGERVIKRVIGLQGDFVSSSGMMLQVPKGHCWVEGDNLAYSRDSRHFGPMPLALITGKVVAKVFP